MTRLALAAPSALLLAACTIVPRPADPQELFWERLQSLCGQAFQGQVTTTDPGDRQLASARLVIHVARCDAGAVRIAFHASADASRTWLITRAPGGLSLIHIHRGEDGREEVRSGYGGETVLPGTARRQSFPANARTRALFRREDIAEAGTNIWSIDIMPRQYLAYAIDREGRHLRIQFDLSRPVRPPGPAWGER